MITFTESQGAEAIIKLQKMAGIEESKESATAAWNSFKDWEKEQTERAYNLFFGESQ